jgi:ADP-L-glycero-D-manno-heptose 6-epimerase
MKPFVLVTGSEGFIGSALMRALLEVQPNVCVLTFNEKDLVKPDWRELLRHSVAISDAIFHVGAISSTDAADVNRTMFCNYEVTKALFDCAKILDTPVIYSSSASVYGDGDNIPKNLYGWTKKLGEDYGTARLKNFISLRYFNVYGPGEAHKGKMASVAHQAYVHKQLYPHKPFYLFPCKPVRDFVYVKDVVSANIHAWQLLRRTQYYNGLQYGGAYDVGAGLAHTFERVLELMRVSYDYRPKSAIPAWYQFSTEADTRKFLPEWRPKFQLEDGIEDYLKFL